jgi:alanyl-tRNA synthetase
MKGDDIRNAFLDYFEDKGHKIIPSSSLIPHGDPTLLLTSAGMVQFKPYFLGEARPPSRRLVSVQKCFRTTDIESVGDTGHLTFFEMLGNFSVGDYFKKEAITYAWEFVTQKLKLSPEYLWITVYLDDNEAFRLWCEQGVATDRILRFGEKENYWGPAGESGPCGSCSEIHYDFGADAGCGKDSCNPACDCGRFSEIWNLVFMEYNQDKAGKRTPLPKPNIDTGMGLERTAAVVQGVSSVYETDLFAPLISNVEEICGKKYGKDTETDRAMRIVAEHSRGIAFLITDGVIPGKEGRGYVLRRLLRRTAIFGRRLGMEKPFLDQMVMSVIEQMSSIYHELEKRQKFVLEIVQHEEARFNDTVITGLELLEGIMEESETISGKQAFKLYDTYGLPVEITAEIACARDLSVDMEGFEKEMVAQREKARASHRFELTDRDYLEGVLDLEATSFTR